MHPGSNEYSMPIRRVVNKFLDDGSWILVELFDRQIYLLILRKIAQSIFEAVLTSS